MGIASRGIHHERGGPPNLPHNLPRWSAAEARRARALDGETTVRPVNRWSCESNAELADLAAAYLVGFARSQGFSDGNKRTGLACALVFLALNGSPLHVPGAELYALTMAVANNQADDTAVAAYFRDRLKSPA